MRAAPYLLHALSPLHAGTGQSVSVIDLPIARMRSTGIPFVPGSSIKGVLRDARTRRNDDDQTVGKLAPNEVHAVFGPDKDNASAHAGALVVGDARLLALPVRSFRGTFAWVTSPLLLELAHRDLIEVRNVPAAIAPMSQRQAYVGAFGKVKRKDASGKDVEVDREHASRNVHGTGKSAGIYLEDIDLPVEENAIVLQWAKALAPLVAPSGHAEMFVSRFVVVDDETMTFLWETATQVDTRVRIDPNTRTVATGALWVEESLPPESILIGVLAADQSRHKDLEMLGSVVLEKALSDKPALLQFGGKATVGRGRCRMVRISFPEETTP